ncbi:protein ALP1-like isoform X2 [Daucus carota subsp. sativus]|uniref:protein ALP1-like isoform X2 n=1 Tax=Daucus carota subsp. sativus TaxID=79200 RepID=UPI003083B0A3
MARLPLSKRNSRRRKRIMLYMVWLKMIASISWYFQMIVVLGTRVALRPRYSIFKMERIHYVDRLVKQSDDMCIKNLRMDMKTFHKLCFTLESRGYIRDTKYMNVTEQVAVFLYILAHHEKMSVLSTNFQRSTETISRHVHMVLNGVLRLQEFKPPEPIPNDSTDEKWKYFKNCLGALDGTHIRMNVPVQDKPRYRNRKGEITINVLAAVTPNLQFTYVLTGWEGSAADGRVLKDALSRKNGLKVPKDAGYTNGEGFLTPFRGVKYHRNEWKEGYQPICAKEYFNMRHSTARNVVERAFGILKKRWAILRSPSFYPLKIQNRIILACCVLHNYIRAEMNSDSCELDFDMEGGTNMEYEVVEDNITSIGTSPEWTSFRDNLAETLFNEWRGSSRR